MGLSGALSSGVTGIRLHQNMLDIIGNNLANVNTYGYKSSRMLFADLLSQSMPNGSGNSMQVGKGVGVGSISQDFSQGTLETTNRQLDFALQGDGFFVLDGGNKDYFTRVGAFAVDANNILVDSNTGYQVMDTSGSAITIPYGSTVQGNGTTSVTLAGNLDASAFESPAEVLLMSSSLTEGGVAATAATDLKNLDSSTAQYQDGDTILIAGTLSDGTPVSDTFTYGSLNDGTTVQAFLDKLNGAGAFGGPTGDTTASLDAATGKIKLKSNTSGNDQLTLTLVDGGSNSGGTTWSDHLFGGATHTTSTTVYDTQGTSHSVSFRFTKESDNTWSVTASMDSTDGTITDNTISNISFNSDGTFSSSGDAVLSFSFSGLEANPSSIGFSLGTSGQGDGLTQNGGASTVAVADQDGYAYGTFDSITVGSDGLITALYTNGQTAEVATMKLALFSNLNGLAKAGDNLFIQTTASGDPTFTTGGSGRAGTIASGYLEGSNVDMATELTALITAQRGFQLNAKVITTADEVLAEAVNIKR